MLLVILHLKTYIQQVRLGWGKAFPQLVSYTRFVELIPGARDDAALLVLQAHGRDCWN